MYTVLEVGGTHVTAALVDLAPPHVAHAERVEIDSSADAETLLKSFTAAVAGLGDEARAKPLVVAIPGPFDYDRGIGDFEGVAKFGSLRGVRVGDELARRLGSGSVTFLNDVTAYGIGQYELLGRPRRMVALTLGTGVGSVFLQDGSPVTAGPGVPPNGWVYLLEHDGRPIEETFSRRAIIAAHAAASGQELDVHEIADQARSGDPTAVHTLSAAYASLAETLAPYLIAFETDLLVVGGSIARSWDLILRWFEPSVMSHFHHLDVQAPRILPGAVGETAALIGAARYGAGAATRR